MSEHRRRFVLVLLYLAVSLPWIIRGAIRSLSTTANSPIDWVSPEFPDRQEFDRFQQQFGSGDLLVISWDGCWIDAPEVDRVALVLQHARLLRDSPQRSYFQTVRSGRDALRQLSEPPVQIPQSEALRRLRGFLVGPDDRTTCLIVAFTSRGVAERARLVPIIRRVVEKVADVRTDQIHLAGPVMDGLMVDEAGRQTLNRFAPVSALLVLALCWLSLNSIPAALLVFGLSVLCQSMTLAILDACGDTLSALLIILPPLIQVLAVAAGIHLVNYYFDALEDMPPRRAAIAAWKRGWLPCSLSSVTTAVGLGSLLVSGLVPVRAFGGYAATGVLLTLAVTLTCLPGVLLIHPFPAQSAGRSLPRRALWHRWVQWLHQWQKTVGCLGLLVLLLAGYGLTQMQTSVYIETLFRDESRILRDYAWLEEHVGNLVPIEIVLHCGTTCDLTLEERLQLLERLKQRAEALPEVGSVFGVPDFVPPFAGQRPAVHAAPQEAQSRSLRSGLLSGPDPEQFRQVVAAANYFAARTEGGLVSGESWRLTAFISARDSMDYGTFLRTVREQLEPELNDGFGAPGADLQLRLTGTMPLVHAIQRRLLRDLFASFLTAFGVIAVMMTLVQAGVGAGLLAMVPNVFPAVVVFGLLGWMQFPLDIGSVMTASVAVGIAVDDTLHFLSFFRQRLAGTADRLEAVHFACCHCGLAMLQTSAVCGLGLLAFAASSFVPTARFAWMMLAMLFLALVGDLVLLPALLIGPLGRLFQPGLSADVPESAFAHEPDDPSQCAGAIPPVLGTPHGLSARTSE